MRCIARFACGLQCTAAAQRPTIRDILETTVRPPVRLRLGTALAELGRRAGLTDDDIVALEEVCDKTPAEPVAACLTTRSSLRYD